MARQFSSEAQRRRVMMLLKRKFNLRNIHTKRIEGNEYYYSSEREKGRKTPITRYIGSKRAINRMIGLGQV